MMPKAGEKTLARSGMVAPSRYTSTNSALATIKFLSLDSTRRWALRYCQLNDHPEGAI